MAPDLHFHTDASGTLGYGGYYHPQWFRRDWDPDQLLGAPGIFISYQELFPIVLAAFIWGSEWSRKQILVFCDNEGTVTAQLTLVLQNVHVWLSYYVTLFYSLCAVIVCLGLSM